MQTQERRIRSIEEARLDRARAMAQAHPSEETLIAEARAEARYAGSMREAIEARYGRCSR